MINTKILIVEDELLIAENLAMKLKKFEYQVVDIVSSGKAAIEKTKSKSPDLILMDIAIKGELDGIQTAEEINNTHNIPIVFLTAYADDKTLERAANSGCHGYILKPFKDRELYAAIKIALKNHQQQYNIQQSLQAKIARNLPEARASNVDSLTQLPNRLCLENLFEHMLSSGEDIIVQKSVERKKLERINHNNQLNSNKSNNNLLAFLCFEIDRFKRINNSVTNEQRDLLIKAIAERLTNIVVECERTNATIKLQNSEFLILIGGIKHQQEATDIARMILNQFEMPFSSNNLEFFLTASIGISFYPYDDVNVNTLLTQGQKAMHCAQEQGGDQYKVYYASLPLIASAAHDDLLIETELHYALERQELELYYQPIVELKTGKISGSEALLRWNHPKMGLMRPDQFIPIAEKSSLIESIGEWVIATACKTTQTWHQLGFNDLSIAVNLSGRQFKQLDLFHKLTQLLYDSTLEPQFLKLELTEKILVENEKLNIQRLNFIKKLGVKISLDDFGTGYSSFGYLQQFPFDILKIDRCFVSNAGQNSKNAVLTKTIIEMAHQLDLKVIAEGVETQSELSVLARQGCDEIQGYLFSRPLPAQEFEQLLSSGKCLVFPQLSHSRLRRCHHY